MPSFTLKCSYDNCCVEAFGTYGSKIEPYDFPHPLCEEHKKLLVCPDDCEGGDEDHFKSDCKEFEYFNEDDWTQVYALIEDEDAIAGLCGEQPHLQRFLYNYHENGQSETYYYKCGGGGPEWGYFEVQSLDTTRKGKIEVRTLYEVNRTWGEPFSITELVGKKLDTHTEVWNKNYPENFTRYVRVVDKTAEDEFD